MTTTTKNLIGRRLRSEAQPQKFKNLVFDQGVICISRPAFLALFCILKHLTKESAGHFAKSLTEGLKTLSDLQTVATQIQKSVENLNFRPPTQL